MDISSGITIGRVRGIEIRVHWSWLLIFVLLSWSLTADLFGHHMSADWTPGQRWVAGIATATLFFVSVLVHELAHSFVAQRYGMHVPSITLFVFGGVSSLAEEMKTAGQEFRVAIAGPLTSFVLAAIFAVVWLPLRNEGISVTFGYLAWINVALGGFNLLPGFPLDGGRVFRAAVWARSKDQLRATRAASRSGTIIAYGLIAFGLVNILVSGLGAGLWYVLIGLFLKSAAEGSYEATLADRALRNVTVRAAMRGAPDPVGATMTVQRLIDERMLATAERAFVVTNNGHVTGLLTATDMVRVSREHRSSTAVGAVMVPVEEVQTVTRDTPLAEAMRTMQQHGFHQLPVVDDGRLLGMLTHGDVLQYVEVRARFKEL